MVRTHHTYFFNLIGRPEGYPNNKDGKSLFFIAMKMKVNMNLRDVGAVSEPVYQVSVTCAFSADRTDLNP